MAGSDVAAKCKQAPRLVLLLVCLALTVIGWIIVLAETDDDNKNDSLWWDVLGPSVEIVMILLAVQLGKPVLLYIAAGFFLYSVPLVFNAADWASEADMDDLSFGYTLCVIGGSLAWLAPEAPKPDMGAIKANIPAVVIFFLSLLAVILLWIDTGALDLSTWAATADLLFFLCVVMSADTCVLGLCLFLNGVVNQMSLQVSLGNGNNGNGNGDGDGGTVEFAGILIFIMSFVQVCWIGVKVLGGNVKPDFSMLKSKLGIGFIVCFLFSVVGAILATDYEGSDDADAWKFVVAIAVLVVVDLCVAWMVGGGVATMLFLFQAGRTWVSTLTLVSRGVSFHTLEGEFKEEGVEFGIALLLICMYVAALLVTQPSMGDVKGQLMDFKSLPGATFWVIFVGWIFGQIAYMDVTNHTYVWVWTGLLSAVMLLAINMSYSDYWGLAAWLMAYMFYTVFSQMLDSDEGLQTITLLILWAGSIVGLVASFKAFSGAATVAPGP